MSEQLLQPDLISILEKLATKAASDTVQRRARILLLYNTGKDTREISETIGLAPRSVRFWRREFLKRGMDIFSSANEIEQPEKLSGKPAVEEPASVRPAPAHKPALARTHFPRVRKNPGIKADDPMAEAGRKILRFHFAHMLSHEKGTRLGDDIEELHDMRVATRRMRAAFEVFGPFFKPKAIKSHLKGLRATGRALGRVRDLDVFMEKAEHHLETLPKGERPGLVPLLDAWRQERDIARDKMLAHLDCEGYQQFKQDFNDFVSTPGAGARSIAVVINPSPNLVRHVAPVLIYTHLAAVRTYETIITNATIEQLHALRIEFKKLRYALEFFREVLGTQAKGVINDLKILQDHLGDLNDANVACQILREFIETWEERQIDLPLQERQNPEPVVDYLAAKHAERHNLMVTFPKAWAHFNRPEFLENIALAISVL
ncbi:MAG: CHAD domain-containing protein [Anaerolineales bacterium]|nr:CHAD domain-containing protein [Anaerolineales bacterium]